MSDDHGVVFGIGSVLTVLSAHEVNLLLEQLEAVGDEDATELVALIHEASAEAPPRPLGRPAEVEERLQLTLETAIQRVAGDLDVPLHAGLDALRRALAEP